MAGSRSKLLTKPTASSGRGVGFSLWDSPRATMRKGNMLCTETMTDLWYEGYGAGLSCCSWVEAVAGRFLSDFQRAALYAGYKTALEDKNLWVQDMASSYAADPTIPY